MRLFTAIELGEDVRSAVGVLSTELQKRVERDAPRARLTWVPPDRMHLTLRFIGEVGDDLAGRIIGALREPLPMAPFVLQFGGLGAFPPKGPPRVLWIGVGSGRDSASRAESTIGERLLALGIPHEERAYSPHLTLARVRESSGLRATALYEGLAPKLGEHRVEAITLFQSKLSPKGPTYVALEKTALRDG